MSSSLIIPYCTGMERSASRMTWQIAKHLAPATPPEDWYPEWQDHIFNFHVVGVEDKQSRQFINWPMRGHEYYPDMPVIYTFRHPVEAFLSLYSRMAQDVGKKVPGPTGKTLEAVPGVRVAEFSWDTPIVQTKSLAMEKSLITIGKHGYYWKKYSNEASQGRKVLFLKYEDLYYEHATRVKAIAEFMGVDASDEVLSFIASETSLQKNLEVVQSIETHYPEAVFSGGGFLGETGLQVGHVNNNIKGMPGKHIEAQPRMMAAIKSATSGALLALREMTEDMGYEL